MWVPASTWRATDRRRAAVTASPIGLPGSGCHSAIRCTKATARSSAQVIGAVLSAALEKPGSIRSRADLMRCGDAVRCRHRKSVVEGKGVWVGVELGGRRFIKKKKYN